MVRGGAARFEVSASSAGRLEIEGFRPGTDIIVLTGTVSIASIVASAVSDGLGGTLLTISPQRTIRLNGLAPSKINGAMFDVSGTVPIDVIVGTAGDDTLVGSAGAVTMAGWRRRRHLQRQQCRRHRDRERRRRNGSGQQLRQLRPGWPVHRAADPDGQRQHQRHRQLARQHPHRQCRQQRPRWRHRRRHDGGRRRQRHLHGRQRRRHW